MDLYDYFYKLKKETGIELQEFAKLCGMSKSYMSCLINFKKHCSFPTAMRIEGVTKGKVTAIDLMKSRQNPVKIPLNYKQSRKTKKKSEKGIEEEQLEFKMKK